MAAYWVAGPLLAVGLSLLSSGLAIGESEKGYAAIRAGDYDTAFREFMPLAVAGDTWAQFFVGALYDRGWGVPRDHAEAVRWYRLAAEQGLAEAQHNLGVMYEEGEDYTEAVRWYRLSADQGFTEAQLALGVMYAGGQGVPQDFILAYMWLNLGLAALPPGKDREALVQVRNTVASSLTAEQVARAQEMARNWRPEVAARSRAGAPAYGDVGEEPPTQRQIGPNPFRAAIERQARETQQLLADLGYDPGPVDGVMGPRTRAAIRAFQADFGLPVDGEMSDDLSTALNDAASSGRSVAARSSPTQPRLDGTGTGFAVGQDRQLVTNHHVVAGCAEVRVRPPDWPPHQEAASTVVVAGDPHNDLALLEAQVRLPAAVLRSDGGIRAGDSVVAVGFPLHGLLASEANVTTGTVSALAGIGDDVRFLQVTVPVQPGNSGGPLLDLHGRVVGVVVGKLDALQVASVTGDIPQNVNFAIKAGVVRSFLQASGVAERRTLSIEEAYGEKPRELSPAAVGARAKESTVLIECWK